MTAKTIELRTPSGAEASIYPAAGFNCIRLALLSGGKKVSVMHAEPDVLDGGSSTRSGMPILFPFPNRISDANYEWRGRKYQVPVTHPGDRHAIHGFVCRAEWADVETDPDQTSATGRFRLSRDAPESLASWPGDLELGVRYELSDSALSVTSTVQNPSDVPVPFGLGFHAYLDPLDRGEGAEAVAACRIHVPAESYWVLDDSIPTGEQRPVDGFRDLRATPVIGDRVLDDVLTGLPPFSAGDSGLMTRGQLIGESVSLSVECDEAWRDVVVFTPENRASVAIEPYTCPTDAVHLDAAGVDVGWRVLVPGDSWSSQIRLALSTVS